ncbi:helix-hairpin-helix domain-containing protein [Amycolatopsis thermophila]|uniref:Helix-hairpin-helix domain-containing protein n=1 Tax=Amycolatopsis thermophila TaxID=206084 RepID=A0ABU0F2A3_9PSEU|nr:hypothetical protein [Amycolatopsis thermophila]MDQ0381474.1 hypothetical protein [Amycolatopsis thermophila]
MTTLTQLRKAALSYPETAEQVSGPGIIAFTVRDRRFASVNKDRLVELRLATPDVEKVLVAHPTAQRLVRGATPIGVRVPIGDINGQQLNHWVRRAWLSRAPKQLAAQVAAGDTAASGAVGDLPKAIGGPATRALTGAGITTLAQVAALTDADLLAMHGVGPRAVRILRETLT